MRRDYKNINNLTILQGDGIIFPRKIRATHFMFRRWICNLYGHLVLKNFIEYRIMKKINETFTCVKCWKIVPLADKTCRNHCPYCFTSLHVDWDIPWDRASECHWIMKPINYEIRNWTMKILFKCTKCGKLHWNKRAVDDDIDTLLQLVKDNQIL